MLKHTLFGLTAVVLSTSVWAGAKCERHPENERIPAVKFQERLQAQGYKIKKFELDDGCYEMKGLDKDGNKVKIYFDTKTGKAVKTKHKG